MADDIYDLAIVGGGINGAGIAADAAGRGLKVVLLEKGDLAQGTSSASSKLIHGGLRYLEHFEFRLVREALQEREILLERAPHLIRPLRFVIPHLAGMRPRSLLRLGLFLYDRLARRRRIPASSAVDLTQDSAGRPLRADLSRGFSYYDCWVDDARLVVSAALDAAERGAQILTRSPVTDIKAESGLWRLTAATASGGLSISARALVNAAGPWCDDVARMAGPADRAPRLRLVKGSHIVVPRIAGADDAYLIQNADGRVVFALPFEQNFTLIGTTDVTISDLHEVATSDDEETYLLNAAGQVFATAIPRSAIVWRFAGVRPLVEDGAANASAVSRDYRLDLVSTDGAPPLLNVIGGKVTTFRRLAEGVVERLAPYFPDMSGAWTATSPLPGGDFGAPGFGSYCRDLASQYPGIEQGALFRLARLYGTRSARLIGDATSLADFGADLGGGLSEREVVYLRDHEWARSAEDVLWRRTKAGLAMSAAERARAEASISELLAR